MDALIPSRLRLLCRLDDIPDGGAKGFRPPPRGPPACSRCARATRFSSTSMPARIGISCTGCRTASSADGRLIVCSTHGAEFRIADGVCVRGPCHGDALEAVPVTIDGNRAVMVAEEAGR